MLQLFARRTKEMGAVTAGYWEWMESWMAVFRDLRARGIDALRLLVADGHPAI